ncbi:MAG: HEAT repeat domain-containing protein [Planctomycetota bacterium]
MNRAAIALAVVFIALVAHPDAPAQDDADDPNLKKLQELRYQEFVKKLPAPDSIDRGAAIDSLKGLALAKAHRPLLEMAVDERYAYLASFAAETAVALDAPNAQKLVEQFVRKHKGKSRRIDRNLVLMLRECPSPKLAELSLEEFDDSSSKVVRLEVIRSVGIRQPKGSVSYLRAALASRDMADRNVAAIAAAKLGSPELIAPLFAGLEVTDDFHAMFAAYALTRIEDASIFGNLVPNLGSASGVTGEAKAKVLEGSATKDDIESLITVLKTNRSREYREAAAIALGRVGERKKDVQEILFARMLRDSDREVRGACWHALTRVATEAIVPKVLKRLGQKDPEHAKYVYHLVGLLQIREAARVLRRVVLQERKNPMLRYAAAINYWRVADSKEIDDFEEMLIDGRGQILEFGLEASGFRRNPEGFRFLLKMLKVLREGSREQYQAELALQRMTGHFFGPYPGIWKKWYQRNPDFFTPKQEELEREKWREDFDKENKGWRHTEATERAVQLALEFIARHQNPDGRFDPQHFHKECPDTPKCKPEGARIEFDPTGTTALGCLAFFGAWYNPEHGKYKHVVGRAMEYLLARMQANGNFLSNDLVGGYNRPVGAQAFAEAAQLTDSDEFRWYAQRGIDFLTTIQNRLGGWRYRVKIETTDTSCMSWNLFALKTGEKAGLEVKEIAYAGCYRVMDLYSTPVKEHREEFLDIDPDYGYEVGRDTKYEYETGYQNPVWDTKYATVPLGMMCRIFMGWRRSHPFCIGSANKILEDMLEEIPRGENWSLYRSQREYPTYAWYYGTLAMHQMGGRYFRLWNERIRKILPGTQEHDGCMRGSWPIWNHDSINGRVVTAALGALTLETYYRYLPVLQD